MEYSELVKRKYCSLKKKRGNRESGDRETRRKVIDGEIYEYKEEVRV